MVCSSLWERYWNDSQQHPVLLRIICYRYVTDTLAALVTKHRFLYAKTTVSKCLVAVSGFQRLRKGQIAQRGQGFPSSAHPLAPSVDNIHYCSLGCRWGVRWELVMIPPLDRTTALCTAFSSSRTFPGQS